MELFTGDISVIKNEIEDLREHVCRCKNVSEARNVIYTLYALIDMYFMLDGDEIKDLKKMKKNKYYNFKAGEQSSKLCKKYIENFLENKNFHKYLMFTIMLRYEEEYDKIMDYYNKIHEISDDKKIEIISGFLSTMNDTDKETFINLINDKRIFLANAIKGYDGMCSFNCINGNSVIILGDEYENDIMLMTTLVHEFGHLIDYNNIFLNHSSNTKNNFFLLSSYKEVMSKFYEKEFLEYLIDNDIETNLAKRELECFYTSLFNNAEDLLLLTNLDNNYLKTYKYRDIDCSELNEILNDLSEEYSAYYENYITDDTPLKDVEIEEAISYAYGGIIATYLSYLKHSDYEKFNRVFNKFNSNKTDLFNDNLLDVLETDSDELNDIIFNELKVIEQNSKVYKK